MVVIVNGVTCPFCSGRALPDSCQCLCTNGFLPPTCSFTAEGAPTVVLILQATTFNSELLLNAVQYAALTTNVTFAGARNVSTLGYMRANVILPGYAVSRLLNSVAFRDPWTAQYSVVSAYVLTAPPSAAASLLDTTLYSNNGYIITVNGVLFLAIALVLTILLFAFEDCFFQNVEGRAETRATRKRNQKPQKAREIQVARHYAVDD